MNTFLIANEPFIRIACFSGFFFIIALWEVAAPRRPLHYSKGIRWTSNLAVSFFNSFLLRALFPVLAVELAMLAQERTWGLLNYFILPEWIASILSVVLLDLVIYLQHVLFHAVPALWRLHRMHHTDLDYDVTTAARFHPIEILLSMIIKLVVVAALGPPPVAVLIFEILLNGTAMFNHGNILIPVKLDLFLRLAVVTPDMHRVHHSMIPRETNSNYGFNLPWWDRLFGTYCDQPRLGHEKMTLGIETFRAPRYLKFHWLLLQPFLMPSGESSDSYHRR
ncbi:MAG: sterol desaturase family protein [Nitrospiria bacterium]